MSFLLLVNLKHELLPLFPSLLNHSLSLCSLTEVAGAATMVFARRSSQDVFLPDGPGQPAPTASPEAPPPTYAQSVSPPAHGAKSTTRAAGSNTKHLAESLEQQVRCDEI